MLSIDQVKQIAEHVGLEFKRVDRTGVRVRRYGFDLLSNKFDYTGLFIPEKDDADAMQVFKALVDECSKRNLEIHIDIFIHVGRGEYSSERFDDDIYTGKFNNESICLAYLAVMSE